MQTALNYCGCPVIKMRRVSIGDVHLDETLGEGEFRPMTEEEIAACFA